MDIDLRLLRSLVAIYELGSLSRAADQLCCTQAAMSMRLKMLEDKMGSQLFMRRHHRLEPTPLASETYAKALGVIASYDEFISTTRSRAAITKVRIGAPDDYAYGILTAAMRELYDDIDDIEIEIICDLSANLHAALHRQNLDLSIVSLVSPPASVCHSIEARLSWVHHPERLVEVGPPLMLSTYPEGCTFRRAMIAALEAAEIPWRIANQSRSQIGVLAAVRAGLAVTSMAQGTEPPDLVAATAVNWLPPLKSIPIYLMRSDSAPNAAVSKIESILRNHLNTLNVAA